MRSENILFLDIETVPMASKLEEIPEDLRHLFIEKVTKTEEDLTEEEINQRGGLYAEFGKIVCISVGLLHLKDGKRHLRIKSFYSDDEKELLMGFAGIVNQTSAFVHGDLALCGHNSKSFDLPFIARRMIINNIPLPVELQTAGKKPWELKWLDTMELWRCGDTRHSVQLKLLCALFGITTPKDDIDGSQVAEVYYKEKNLDRIAFYCEKDVRATTQVYLRIVGEEILPDENVYSTSFNPDGTRIENNGNENK